jgi:hypothetical protein
MVIVLYVVFALLSRFVILVADGAPTKCANVGPSGTKDEETGDGLVLLQSKMELKKRRGGELKFIHIPKNGGTSIEQVGRENNVSWGMLDSCSGAPVDGYVIEPQCPNNVGNCSSWHSPRHLQANCPSLAEDSFCVTRDPYDRLVSEYKYACRHLTAENPNEPDCSAYPQCSIAGLNHFIQEGLGRSQDGDYCVWDCHARPQADFIWRPDGSRFCQNVLRLEEFPDAFNDLMASHMSPIRLAASHNEATICDNVTAHHLTAETRSLIESVYAVDFIQLNYSFRSFRMK